MDQDALIAFANLTAAKNKLEKARAKHKANLSTPWRDTAARKAKGAGLYQAVLDARRNYEAALEAWRNAPHPYGYVEPAPV